jgi:hypothetical protein
LAAVVPAVAFADTEEIPDLPVGYALNSSGSTESPELTDPAAAEELPHQNLSREGAIELTEEVFDPILEDAVGPIQGLEAEKYLSNHAAIVPGGSVDSATQPGGTLSPQESPATRESVLLESTLPLLTEGDNENLVPVDLSLEASGDALKPVAGLVPVEIPKELGSGLRLPSLGVEIELPAAAESRAPSIINDTVALYPNIDVDTDFSAISTPTGLETLTTLRSPAAPTQQRFELDMPEGATLLQANGGALVKLGDETILSVEEPSALDAAGANVPVTLDVEDNSLIVTATPPPDAQYPVLVDPLYHSYDWYYSQSSVEPHQDAWRPSTNREGLSTYADTTGLHVRARHEWGYTAGSQADWTYEVPRLKAEQQEHGGRSPTSYVQSMALWHMYFLTSPGNLAPYMFAGIWGDNGWAGNPGGQAVWWYAGNAPSFYMNTPGLGSNVSVTNGEPGERDRSAKRGVLGLASLEYAPPTGQDRYAGAGGFAVEVGDDDAPWAGNGNTTAWANQTAVEPLVVTGEDTGLGVKRVGFDLPYQGPKWVVNSCVGIASSPCPVSWTAKLMTPFYNPGEMPQGLIHIPIDAEDVVGNRAIHGEEHVDVRVDHSSPEIGLSGSITEQASIGTNAASYQLDYSAKDGDNATAAALAPFGTAGVGVGKFQRPFGVAIDSSGNSFVVDRECKCVQKYDTAGKFLSQFGTPGTGNGQFSDPRGISYSRTTGNILVADYTNKNVQIFTPSGAFVRKVTYGSFVEPYAVAHTGGNSFWVTDIGSDKVFAFRESDGAYLGQAYGSPADPNGSATGLLSPVGVAADPTTGRMFVSDNGLNRVTVFSIATGKYSHHFGSGGTGNGQFRGPVGIAVAPSGHVLVADDLNSRIQVFQPTGSYMRQFGLAGSDSTGYTGNNQLKEPRGLAIGPENTLYVADAGNKRIARWSHADLDLQSGVRKLQIKVDGQVASTPVEQTCVSVCGATGAWTLNADSYPVGPHNVEATVTDGVGLATTKTVAIETHGDLTPPTVALSGTITEQASLGNARPSYKLKVQASDPGASNERKSGVASLVIKVDGVTKDSTAPGCPAGSCAITREWTLNSDSYSAGSHSVQITATDAAGRSSAKTLPITIERDKVQPQIAATNTLFTAPEGWVEQMTYNYSPTATDLNGYGLSSFVFKIDGSVVKSQSLTCPAGGCAAMLSGTVNMTAYAGGAHPAELVATDGAGNVAKKSWSINVDPAGAISVGEVTDTLEAVEETAEESQPVASTPEFLEPEIIAAGDNPHFSADSNSLDSTGVPTDTSIDLATGAVTIDGADAPLVITPVGEGQSSSTKVESGVAAVTPNVKPGVDRVIRPEYNGALFFTDIRLPTSPESFSWNVHLDAGQTLVQVNDQHAEIIAEDGFRKALISAMPAHDATGKEVPTHLAVSGSVVTLVVPHKAKGFSYPVLAGQSYQVGYSSVVANIVLPELNEEPEDVEEEEWLLEPLSPAEHSDLLGYLSGGGPQRNPFKPITVKQAKRLAKSKRITRRVPPPTVPLIGGPGGNGSGGYELAFPLRGYRCSEFDCDIWNVKFDDETQFIVGLPGTNSHFVRYATAGTHIDCDGDVMFWWELNITLSTGEAGTRGPKQVKKGSGEYLTFFCKFNIAISPLPEAYFLDLEETMITRVYANGYQVNYARERNTFVQLN